jgi:hypothetical protein
LANENFGNILQRHFLVSSTFRIVGFADANAKYEGPSHTKDKEKKVKRNPMVRDWADAILFAVVAATIITNLCN